MEGRCVVCRYACVWGGARWGGLFELDTQRELVTQRARAHTHRACTYESEAQSTLPSPRYQILWCVERVGVGGGVLVR